jgi:hypothetical protein
LGEWELVEQRKLALAEAGSLGTLGFAFHLGVIILQELARDQPNMRMRK